MTAGRLIIIDGMDRCGKSTLVKYVYQSISKRNPRTIVLHCDKPPVSLNYEDTINWSKVHYIEMIDLVKKLTLDGWNVILDRSWVGEYVYGKLYRKYDTEWVKCLYFHDVDKPTNIDMTCGTIYSDLDIDYAIIVDDENVLSRSDSDSLYDDASSLDKKVTAIRNERLAFLEIGKFIKSVNSRAVILDHSNFPGNFAEKIKYIGDQILGKDDE